MSLIDFLFPKRCFGCGKEEKYLCSGCLAGARYVDLICPVCRRPSIDGLAHVKCRRKYGLDGLVSFYAYDGVIRKALLTMKYRFSSDVAYELADLVYGDIGNLEIPFSGKVILTPIPMHAIRENWRGFNQSEEIGKVVAKKIGWRFIPDLLLKSNPTVSQTKLLRKKRLGNIRGSFIFNPRYSLVPKPYNLIIFDDVFTTGATMKEACSVLKRKGAESVWGLTVAR